MKSARIYLAASLAAVALAGCGTVAETVGSTIPPVATAPAQTTTMDERAMLAVESAWNVPAYAFVQLDAAGKLPPAIKPRAQKLLLDAKVAIGLARHAYNTANAANFAAQVKEAYAAIAEVKRLLPPTPG